MAAAVRFCASVGRAIVIMLNTGIRRENPPLSAAGRGRSELSRVVVLVVMVGLVSVLVIAGILALIFVVVVIIRRTQVDGIEQHADHFGVHLGQKVAGAAERLFGGLPG